MSEGGGSSVRDMRNVEEEMLKDLNGNRRYSGQYRIPVDLHTNSAYYSADKMRAFKDSLLSIYSAPDETITNIDAILSSETASGSISGSLTDFNSGCSCSGESCCDDLQMESINSCACIVERKRILEGWSVKLPWDAAPNYHHDGRLFSPISAGAACGPPIVECGPRCSCAAASIAARNANKPPPCRNRVSQFGSRARLNVQLTRHSGLGVFASEDIRAGTFLCIYKGRYFFYDEKSADASSKYYNLDVDTPHLYLQLEMPYKDDSEMKADFDKLKLRKERSAAMISKATSVTLPGALKLVDTLINEWYAGRSPPPFFGGSRQRTQEIIDQVAALKAAIFTEGFDVRNTIGSLCLDSLTALRDIIERFSQQISALSLDLWTKNGDQTIEKLKKLDSSLSTFSSDSKAASTHGASSEPREILKAWQPFYDGIPESSRGDFFRLLSLLIVCDAASHEVEDDPDDLRATISKEGTAIEFASRASEESSSAGLASAPSYVLDPRSAVASMTTPPFRADGPSERTSASCAPMGERPSGLGRPGSCMPAFPARVSTLHLKSAKEACPPPPALTPSSSPAGGGDTMGQSAGHAATSQAACGPSCADGPDRDPLDAKRRRTVKPAAQKHPKISYPHLRERWFPSLSGADASARISSYLKDLKKWQYTIDPLRYGGSVAHLFNHSCEPNCSIVPIYQGLGSDARIPCMAFFTSRDIKAGEELFWSYVNPQTKQFQQLVQDLFGGKCLCASCSQKSSLPADLREREGGAAAAAAPAKRPKA